MVEIELALADVLSREEPAVPPSPPVVRAIGALGRGNDLRIDDLTRLAFADPASAADLLAAAGGAGEIASLPEAAVRLGEPRVLEIVRDAVRSGGAAPAGGPLAMLRHRAGEMAVVAAFLCRELARARDLPVDEAYACGLLHDVGALAALAAVERLAAGTRPGRAISLSRWARLAERWHVPLGVVYAERRRLARSVVEAIAFHHDDGAAPAQPSPLVRVVRSVDALVAVVVDGADPAEAVALADLTDDEADRLSRALEPAQVHVASLARLAPPPGADGADDAPAPPLREPKGRGVRLRLAGREYAAVGFGAHQLLVSGPAPLGEGALLSVEVLDRRRSAFHARVLAGWAEGDRFGAILVPFGLSGPAIADFGGVLPAGAAA